MKIIETTEAVGHILCHDITQIVVGEKKGPAFRKGHVVRPEDIPVLLSLGKERLYIWEQQPGFLHENEAAELLADLCGQEFLSRSEVREGKIDLHADCAGLLKVDVERLQQLNLLDELIIATRQTNTLVHKGDKIAGTRIIPLLIAESKLHQAQALTGTAPLLQIKLLKPKKVGIVTTGNEVYNNLVKDTFGPVLRQKLAEFEVEILGQTIVNDNADRIQCAIEDFLAQGAELVLCTGGMSVDPDDLTPSAIKATGARLVTYGAPVLPGAMFLLAYYGENIPIVGLPGCVMYEKRSIFDLILPRLLADDQITKADLASLGHGGLCLSCQVCAFPNCSFGSKG